MYVEVEAVACKGSACRLRSPRLQETVRGTADTVATSFVIQGAPARPKTQELNPTN